MKPSAKRVALNKLALSRNTVEALEPGDKPWIAWDDNSRALESGYILPGPNPTSSTIEPETAAEKPLISASFWVTMARYRPAGHGVWRGRFWTRPPPTRRAGAPRRRACPCWSRPLRHTWQAIPTGPSAPTRLIVAGSSDVSATGRRVHSMPSPAGTWKAVSTASPQIAAGRRPTRRYRSCVRSIADPVSIARVCAIRSICGSPAAAGIIARDGARSPPRPRCCRAGRRASSRRSAWPRPGTRCGSGSIPACA